MVNPRPVSDLSAGARAAGDAARHAARDAAAQTSWVVESVTGTAHRAGPYGHPTSEGRTREPDTGMAWGSLIHALLEHAMRGPLRDRAHLERLANWLTLGNHELHQVVPEALDTVEGVMASEFWQRAMTAKERLVEVPFAVRVDRDVAPPGILYGVIDLAFRTHAEWEVLDYKTDQIVPGIEALVASYRSQVRVYGEYWSRLVEAPVRTGLHFIRAGETRWMEDS